jgi:hypothetical protein
VDSFRLWEDSIIQAAKKKRYYPQLNDIVIDKIKELNHGLNRIPMGAIEEVYGIDALKRLLKNHPQNNPQERRSPVFETIFRYWRRIRKTVFAPQSPIMHHAPQRIQGLTLSKPGTIVKCKIIASV